jgi:hypothetical protein
MLEFPVTALLTDEDITGILQILDQQTFNFVGDPSFEGRSWIVKCAPECTFKSGGESNEEKNHSQEDPQSADKGAPGN